MFFLGYTSQTLKSRSCKPILVRVLIGKQCRPKSGLSGCLVYTVCINFTNFFKTVIIKTKKTIFLLAKDSVQRVVGDESTGGKWVYHLMDKPEFSLVTLS